MSFIQFTIAPVSEAVEQIMDMILSSYDHRDTEAEGTLESLFEYLKEELYVFIEYPYVDRVYRDTFYSYFASKHHEYPKNCIRVSFFEMEIKEKHFRSDDFRKSLQESFRGFIIIRPTFPNIIGRTLIDKRAYIQQDFQICNYTGHVLINGIKLSVTGFPFSSQDTEAISCAETSIWAIMEYFGNRYADYQPANPSKILETLNRHSKKRLLPSNGLTVDLISVALKELGFGTQIYARDEAYGGEIENIISIYIESGIPIIAAIENDILGHAILIIGHESDTNLDFQKAPKKSIDYNGNEKTYIDYSDISKRFIVNDDNLVPYTSINLNNPVEHYDNKDFLDCAITSIVVPLYKKVYLDVQDAKQLALQILTDGDIGYEYANNFVFRFFLASSRSFKDHVSCLQGLSKDIKDRIVLSIMPKFIWCAEIYTRQSFSKNTAKGLIIIDATEANGILMDSLIFAGYPDRCVVKFDRKFLNLPYIFSSYKKYSTNLR